MVLNFPPLDYTLLFPELINFHVERNSSFPIFVYTNESNSDELTEISFLEFGRAAHRVAHALRPSRKGHDGEIVMLIANTDTILHHTVFVGLIIAGWIPFPVSSKNSAQAVANLMEKTNCSRVVTLDHAHKGLIDAVREEINATNVAEPIIYELPTLRYAFPKLGHEVATDPFVPYPIKRPDVDSPVFYLHSSGSTGLPKPIAQTHRVQIEWMSRAYCRQCAKLRAPRRIGVMSLPAFHSFGLFAALYRPIASLVTSIVYAPRTWNDPHAQPIIPTSDNMMEVLKRIECNILKAVPAFLEQMVTSEEAIEVLKKMDMVITGGGPLPVTTGDKLCAAGVPLVCGYGGTEFGGPIMLTSQEDIADGDWMWMRFVDDLKVRWIPQGDETYELQLLTTERYLVAVENIPDVRGYATSDIFRKHPTKDAWKIVGRVDDVIVLASGRKTVPAPMENIIRTSPLVQGAVMFGRERKQVGVLIEPPQEHAVDVNDVKAVSEFRDRIWSVIEEANRSSPTYSRIFKEMILITSIEKRMQRASKGTVQRKATLATYEAEINMLYDAIEASSTVPFGLTEPLSWTNEGVEQWLLQHACALHPNYNANIRADLFSQGFDSLSAIYLRNQILGALQNSPVQEVKRAADHIPLNVVFENPTVQHLSSRIVDLVNSNSVEQVNVVEQHKQAINSMIDKYSVVLRGPADGVLLSSQPIFPAVVLLTGSTGSLGSFLLSQLLQSPVVQRVFAFNRPSTQSIEERQRSAFKDQGLSIDLLDSTKLVYVKVDATLDKFGLSPEEYEEIKNSVTLIIHNAWRLDFNLAITSFEDNVRASRNLVDLGLDSPQKENLRFLFTSSVGSAQAWDRSDGLFPEQVQLDPSAAVGMGYGESKYVSERIIIKSGLHATSLRIGQIVGGKQCGSFSTTGWFPIIVKSSIALGTLPEAVGVVSWLRVEEIASAILETAFATEAPPPALNFVNPRSVSWADIIALVRRAIVRHKGIKADDNVLPIVPFGDWFVMLEKKAENASEGDLAKIPAIKLLEFFRRFAMLDQAIRTSSLDSDVATAEATGLASFSTTKAQRVSLTMANMQAIGEAEVDAWVRYWVSKEFLDFGNLNGP